MATFKELEDYVADEIQELNAIADVGSKKIKDYVNRAQQAFVRQTKCLKKVYALTTVANQESYSLNDLVYHVSSVKYLTDSATEFGDPLKPYPGGYEALPKIKSFSSVPEYYWLRFAHTLTTSVLGTYPIVDTASETINVDAYYFPADMSADGNVSDIKAAWHDAMVHWAVWKLCNIYSHKSAAIRQKALDNKAYYLEIVADAQDAFSMEDEDISQIADEFGHVSNYGR